MPPSSRNQIDYQTVFCHTDAAWKDDHRAGFGWILKDQTGKRLHSGTGLVEHVNSPLQAEALAVLLALNQIRQLDFSHVTFASDSSQLVKAINSKLQFKELHGIHFDILDLSSSFTVFKVLIIPRSQNNLADSMAKKTLNFSVMGLAQF
ncbi:putative ribonuclease H domain-containing protein [Arabidopsis thaliana]